MARAKQIVLETKALRDGLPPNFDAILEEAGGPGGLRSLFARMGCLLPALVNPEAAHFREKHGSALATAFSLLRNLRSYFHAAPRGGKKLMGETPGPEVISTETL